MALEIKFVMFSNSKLCISNALMVYNLLCPSSKGEYDN